ncbi:hypothetical protein BDV96DRAFT_169206 [Lophiotrema nucula]|uniref:Uncharacterized protein n=1 Tax=Lophiotrema nucula TaxID=690887 RepID=A0A6A5YZ67_9PLEO|nr:hypothetical protein BDV96DRAFT_169206 [Lophiotrema nucula]
MAPPVGSAARQPSRSGCSRFTCPQHPHFSKAPRTPATSADRCRPLPLLMMANPTRTFTFRHDQPGLSSALVCICLRTTLGRTLDAAPPPTTVSSIPGVGDSTLEPLTTLASPALLSFAGRLRAGQGRAGIQFRGCICQRPRVPAQRSHTCPARSSHHLAAYAAYAAAMCYPQAAAPCQTLFYPRRSQDSHRRTAPAPPLTADMDRFPLSRRGAWCRSPHRVSISALSIPASVVLPHSGSAPAGNPLASSDCQPFARLEHFWCSCLPMDADKANHCLNMALPMHLDPVIATSWYQGLLLDLRHSRS